MSGNANLGNKTVFLKKQQGSDFYKSKDWEMGESFDWDPASAGVTGVLTWWWLQGCSLVYSPGHTYVLCAFLYLF